MAVAASHAPAAGRAPTAPAPPSRAPRLLLVALAVLVAVAAFAGGSTDVPEESRLQLGLLAVAGAAAAAWLYGGGLAFCASRTAWSGVALLAAFALWSGASIAWSVTPDRSWSELNRGIAYALIAVLGIALGSSLLRAHARACAALSVAVGLVALYALGAKTLPGFTLGGLIDLDRAAELTRLSAPLGYWNALGLLVALAALPCLAVALDRGRALGVRLTALAGTAVLLLVLALTYSRGAAVALGVALVVVLALSPARARILAWLAAAALGAAGPLLVAVSRDDLTTDGLALARREDDALLVLGALLVAIGLLVVIGRSLVALEGRGAFTPARDRLAVAALAAVTALVLVVAVAGVAASDGGFAGAADDFTQTRADALTDPGRFLSTNSGNRWAWWKEALGAWSDRPVAGWGAGSFPVTHELYRAEPLDVQQPHSMPLQWLAETGAIGFALALGGLLALIGAALARVRETDGERIASAALAASGVAWLVHSLYDWDWDIPGATAPMLLALGVVAGRPATATPRSPVARGLGLGGVVAGLLAAAVLAALPALADSQTERALDLAAAEDSGPTQLAEAAAQAELAARLFPVSVEPLFATASIAQRIGDVPQARRQVFRAIDRQPESSEAWARLVRIELVRGDLPGLERAARRLVTLDPRDPGTLDLAGRAQAALTLPEGSPTATGSPLPKPVAAGPPPPAPVAP